MKYQKIISLVMLGTIGCGGVSSTQLSASARIDLAERAEYAHHSTSKSVDYPVRSHPVTHRFKHSGSARLPMVSKGAIWADGRGRTQEDAILDGRRIVSQQLVSKLSSEIESYETTSSMGNEHGTHVRIRSLTQFEDAELIRTVGVAKGKSGYVARVALQKREAAGVYLKKYRQLQSKLVGLAPILHRAATELDTAVLLNASFSPSAMASQLSIYSRILRVLGQSTEAPSPKPVVVAEARASKLRRKAEIVIDVRGAGPDVLKRAVAGEVGRVMRSKGCAVRIGHLNELPAGRPVAHAIVRLNVRKHVELGLFWRYLGLQIDARDARSETPFFQLNAMPEILHGGGPTWAMADSAAVRSLRAMLEGDLEESFDGLACRSL